ncbi:MAG TPA: D-Ala-D-Ala carboxypeptidase family metallohydrolase [Dictyoglomaceae bacterium]|nr:D-Ala-D-Ala carboxypeptidase family metallohydrolase [Dictyoglomaceae bacterium]
MLKTNAIKISKNFYLSDFQCRCCQRVMLHPDLLEKMDRLSEEVKEKIQITSGYRCEKHNKEVGGVPNSKHTKGLACDLTCKNLKETYESVKKLGFSFTKLDERKKYIHVEV